MLPFLCRHQGRHKPVRSRGPCGGVLKKHRWLRRAIGHRLSSHRFRFRQTRHRSHLTNSKRMQGVDRRLPHRGPVGEFPGQWSKPEPSALACPLRFGNGSNPRSWFAWRPSQGCLSHCRLKHERTMDASRWGNGHEFGRGRLMPQIRERNRSNRCGRSAVRRKDGQPTPGSEW